MVPKHGRKFSCPFDETTDIAYWKWQFAKRNKQLVADFEKIDKKPKKRQMDEETFLKKWGFGPFYEGLESDVILEDLKTDDTQIPTWVSIKVFLNSPSNVLLQKIKTVIEGHKKIRKHLIKSKALIHNERLRRTEYETYLQAWDLKQANKTYHQIAEQIFKRKLESNDDAYIRQAKRFVRNCEKLINGGYKYLT